MLTEFWSQSLSHSYKTANWRNCPRVQAGGSWEVRGLGSGGGGITLWTVACETRAQAVRLQGSLCSLPKLPGEEVGWFSLQTRPSEPSVCMLVLYDFSSTPLLYSVISPIGPGYTWAISQRSLGISCRTLGSKRLPFGLVLIQAQGRGGRVFQTRCQNGAHRGCLRPGVSIAH